MRRLNVTTWVVRGISFAFCMAVFGPISCNRGKPSTPQAPVPADRAIVSGDDGKIRAPEPLPSGPAPTVQTPPRSGDAESLPVLESYDKGELHLFLPFRVMVGGHNVDAVNSYLVIVPRAFDAQDGHETYMPMLVRKGGSRVYGPDGVSLNARLEAGANGAWLILRNASTRDNSIQVLGFPDALTSVAEVVPGRELFRLEFDVVLSEDTIVRLDAGSGKTKTEKRPRKKTDPTGGATGVEDGSAQVSAPAPGQAVDSKHPEMTNTARNILDLRTLGVIPGPDAVSDLAVKDGLLYIARGEEQRIDMYDVRDLGVIKAVGSFELSRRAANKKKRGRWPESALARIELSPPYAFVLNSGWKASDDVLILNLLNLAEGGRPTLAATYESGSDPIDVRIDGKIAYLLTRDNLQVLDVSNPLRPRKLRVEKLYSGSSKDSDVFGMAVSTGGVYVSGYSSDPYLLRIPVQAGATERVTLKKGVLAATLGESGRFLFVAKVDLAGQSVDGLEVFSADSAGSLHLQKIIPMSRHAVPAKMVVRDGRLYVLFRYYPPDTAGSEIGNFDTLRVYHAGNQTDWSLVDAYATEAKCPGSALAFEGRHVYLGMDRGCGVVILDRG